MVQITPTSDAEAPLIEFDLSPVGKFHLPVLGQPGVPFGITSAFGLFMHGRDGGEEQKLAAWSQLTATLADSYPQAVRVMSRLNSDDIAAVFKVWGEQSKDYDPKA